MSYPYPYLPPVPVYPLVPPPVVFDPYAITWAMVSAYTYLIALSYYLELYKMMLDMLRKLVVEAKPTG